MNLRTKVIALIVTLFVVLSAAQLAVQSQVLLPSFAALERQSAKTDMARVVHVIRRELDLLGVSANNWGNWEDTYRYMIVRNQDYVTHNLYPAALRSMKIDVMALIDSDGKFAWSAAYDPRSGKPFEIDFLAAGELPANHPWRRPLRAGTAIEGLIGTNRGALLAALTPVLDGQGHGPNRGAVLVGRLLTDTEIARIGEQAETKLSLLKPRATGSAVPPELRVGAILDGPDTLVELSTVTDVYRTLDDVDGRPLVGLRSTMPREISARGRQTVAYTAIFLIATGALVLWVLLMSLNRTILAPLSQITRHAMAVGEHDQRLEKLSLGRTDEIGTLAREFQRMVDRRRAGRRELVDRSFESGVYERASGALHNIGNTMTPLTVDIVTLQKRLGGAPTADVLLAVAELDRPNNDPSRHADLVHFLCLTSLELAELVRSAGSDMITIARQAQAVQHAVADQRDVKRVASVEEMTSLVELVEHTTEIVPAALRRRLSIRMDASVAAVGILWLARITLQQVLQNLFVNAAEAMPDGGELRITAEMLPGLSREQLYFRIEDDGVGIAVEDIGRIFERGFSTKSEDTNSGIGLHWCANALNALGGSIRATSEGSGRGACLHVVMPADRPDTLSMTEVA